MSNDELAAHARGKANAATIVRAAERLFWQHGYHKARIADVASGLGMSRANVYRFFSSKEQLRREVFRGILDASYLSALSISKLPVDAASRIRKYLQKQHSTTVDIAENHRAIYDFIILGLDRDHDLVTRHLVRIRSLLTMVIADGIDRGEFAPQDAHRVSSIFMMATAKVWHPKLISNHPTRRNDAQLHRILDFALNGLKPIGIAREED